MALLVNYTCKSDIKLNPGQACAKKVVIIPFVKLNFVLVAAMLKERVEVVRMSSALPAVLLLAWLRTANYMHKWLTTKHESNSSKTSGQDENKQKNYKRRLGLINKLWGKLKRIGIGHLHGGLRVLHFWANYGFCYSYTSLGLHYQI